MKIPRLILLGLGLILFSGCASNAGGASPSDSALLASETISPSPFAPEAGQTPSATVSPFPTTIPTLAPGEWKTLPFVPTAGAEAVAIYQRGLELGNKPQAFSKIGDCESTPAWFLGAFDKDANDYHLGPYTSLAEVIQEFHGSFSRNSIAARRGFNSSSVFSPLWNDPSQCHADEGPLACEYRIQRPSFAFIMLGSNDYLNPSGFESNLRQIVEFSIQNGVVPILSTKADNLEEDESINASIAEVAQEYGLPLWNFWAAVQSLPDQGLQEDEAHLTWAPNYFDDPANMQFAWPVRNLTALQTLDSVWRGVTGRPPAAA